jgi:hypothetical protein
MARKQPPWLARFHEEVWTNGNEASIDLALTPDCVVHHQSRWHTHEGVAAFKRFHRSVTAALEDFRVTIHDTIENGNKVAVHWTITSLLRRTAGAAAGRRNRIKVSGMTIAHRRRGRIAEACDVRDAAEVKSRVNATRA